jgi:hypothetical protein
MADTTKPTDKKEQPKPTVWDELRKPFPAEVVGKLPRGNTNLDYVGHAAVTDRLLKVDPEWQWEPLAVDEYGLPVLDEDRNLWIKLTVNGVTRLGVGDGRNMKERIGDALRNAAMRFGVALDLWTKDELESTLDNPERKNKPAALKERPGSAGLATDNQRREITRILTMRGYETPEAQRDKLESMGETVPLSVGAASRVLGALKDAGTAS